MDAQLRRRSPYLFNSLISLLLLLILSSPCRSDPDPLLDFCVAKLQANNLSSNGFPCKAPSDVVSDDFYFDGLSKEGNMTSNVFGSLITEGSVLSYPGLNTLGISLNRIDYAVGGLNPPHSHPRASEVLNVLKGKLLVGFVSSGFRTSGNMFYSKVLKVGDNFVFPRGLMHFQYNVGKRKAVAIASFNSQNPGLVLFPIALFGSKPSIPNEILTKAFQLDAGVVNRLKSTFAF